MQTILWLFLGLAAGSVFIIFTRKLGEAAERRVLGLTLVAAALIYAVFAAASNAPGWVAVELIGVLVFSAFAELGVKRSVLWLMAGWAAHPLWDAGLHLYGVGTEVAPAIYVFACIGFDVSIAAYIFLMTQRQSVAAARRD
ncbi:MAG TPA: DUF6010 family protein [Pyrinomonadaceae bacterium]|nr:DUF6010 family protein [Pyrinomonadaceae bacterium]